MNRRSWAGLGVLLAGAAGVARCRLPAAASRVSAPAGEPGAEEPASPGSGVSEAIDTSDALVPETSTEAMAEPQVRALWVDAFHDGIKTPAQVDALVHDARAAGVNTLIVQVRRRGDAYYNRTAEPRTEDPDLAPGFDVLQAVIDRARAVQPAMEVHAWIATVALWNKQRHPPVNPAHTYNIHGPSTPDGQNWISLNNTGQAWDGDNYMLDPGHPDAARYVAGVAVDLAREYAVDGIHLDLIRYAGQQWGYNPTSVSRYNRQYGTSGLPGMADPRWQQWRRDQITALVRRVYLDCLAVRTSLKVTAAVIGWGAGPVDERSWRSSSAYRNVFQDWMAWLEEGIVDMALPMNYNSESNPTQRAWLDQWLAWEKQHQGKRQVAAGIGLFLNDPAAGLAQIRRALAPAANSARLAGVALYSYAVSNAPARGSELPAMPNSQFFAMLSGKLDDPAPDGQEPLFAGRAPLPPMPWKDHPSAHLRGIASAQGMPLDGATIQVEGPSRLTLQTDGSGYFGAPDLVPGSYTITLRHGGRVRTQVVAALPSGRATTVEVAE
jgi:uncharacterized lipoprotein YddW (UPF0748 family)